MKLKITSQEKFVLNNIVEMIRNLQGKAVDGTYSSAIEFAISELVKNEMRINAERLEWEEQGNILDLALSSIRSKLKKQLDDIGIDFNPANYFDHVGEQLNFPAREIMELGARLVESRKKQRFGSKESLQSVGEVPFEVVELGLSDAIDGLLARPLVETYEIDPESLKDRYEIEGDWFPFQIIIDNFTFVIDDDGTIFVSIENLPSEVALKARKSLQQLAGLLYFNPLS